MSIERSEFSIGWQFTCSLPSGFPAGASALCRVAFGTDPFFTSLPYSASSTGEAAANGSVTVSITERLNSSITYYYRVTAIQGDNPVITVLGSFSTGSFSKFTCTCTYMYRGTPHVPSQTVMRWLLYLTSIMSVNQVQAPDALVTNSSLPVKALRPCEGWCATLERILVPLRSTQPQPGVPSLKSPGCGGRVWTMDCEVEHQLLLSAEVRGRGRHALWGGDGEAESTPAVGVIHYVQLQVHCVFCTCMCLNIVPVVVFRCFLCDGT